MANVFIKLGKFKEAQAILNCLLRIDPDNVLYNVNMMILFDVYINNEKLRDKYKYITERIILREK